MAFKMIITHGTKIGLHTILPGRAIPLVREAKNRGAEWPLVKNVNSPGVSIDVKAISPQTITITRFINPNGEWEACQNVQLWSQATRELFARESIQLIFDKTNDDEFKAADYWEVVNEASPKGFYKEFGLALIELVKEADRRGVKLALPALNSGTPEHSEMIAITDTGLFGLMKAGGHILSTHEGIVRDKPVDVGFGDLIPGALPVIGAGSICCRYRYLYSILKARNEVVPLVVSEFYGGGSYNLSPGEQVKRFEWYDREVRKDWYVLAILPFTIDPPATQWQDQNYTYCYSAVLEYLIAEKNIPNATIGETKMEENIRLALIDDWKKVQALAIHSLGILNGLAPVKHTMNTLTNQQVLSLFRKAFPTPDYFDNYVVRAGLASIANARTAPYTGKPIEDLPLFQVEKDKLIAAL